MAPPHNSTDMVVVSRESEFTSREGWSVLHEAYAVSFTVIPSPQTKNMFQYSCKHYRTCTATVLPSRTLKTCYSRMGGSSISTSGSRLLA
jgi:hypothetical protein